MIGCLRTRVRKQPIIALYFESELVEVFTKYYKTASEYDEEIPQSHTADKYVLKRVSFGSKDCTKELQLQCAYFLGQTS